MEIANPNFNAKNIYIKDEKKVLLVVGFFSVNFKLCNIITIFKRMWLWINKHTIMYFEKKKTT